VPTYSVCSLWNATYDLTFSFNAGAQNISHQNVTPINLVPYPIGGRSSDAVQLSYSAVFWAIADQLVGTIGVIGSLQNGVFSPSYGSIDTALQRNSLLGSDSLDYFFDINSAVNSSLGNSTILKTGVPLEWPLSGQRILDKDLSNNLTLPNLIELLSFNATVSFLNDSLLA
jgi:hypothetical protein